MNHQLPVIIVVVPLVLSFVNSMAGRRHANTAYILTLVAMTVCLGCSAGILNMVSASGAIHYHFGGWPPPVGIEFAIDHLNGFMLVLISFIGLVAAVHAKKIVEKELARKIPLFWCLYLLLITGLMGIATTGDLFNLFVFLEVTSLTGYALVAFGSKKATVAGFRYLIFGTIGACFYLLGVGYLYLATGTLNMGDLEQILPGLYHSRTVVLGFSFLIIGMCIKTALFPMHTWLLDAYTHASSAVSPVVAPLITKVMAYVIIRVMFTVFEPAFSVAVLNIADIMVWMGTLAILFGAVTALSQTDFRRMLSYIIIAEIGYIIGGIGLANTIALKGAVFHIINDAVMMTCLFLVAGQVMYQKGGLGLDDFTGFFKTMPATAAVFTVGALAVIGVPPTCGFFSKWYLLLGGIQAGQWGFVAALAICTLINIALFFKIFDRGLYTRHYGTGEAVAAPVSMPHGAETPKTMIYPAMLVAFVIVLMGIFNQFIVNVVLGFTIF